MLYAGGIIKRRANIVLESYLKLLESVLFHFGWQALSRVCPFCPHCPGAIKTEPIQCTMPSKHGALYPRTVGMPNQLPLLIQFQQR